MGRIQSKIGLLTGTASGGNLDSLMALAAKPRGMLLERTDFMSKRFRSLRVETRPGITTRPNA